MFVEQCRERGFTIKDHPHVPLTIYKCFGGQSERGFPAVYINGIEYDADTPAELVATVDDKDYSYVLRKTNRPDPDPEVIRFNIIPDKGVALDYLRKYTKD